jgi:hypothetical protein
MPFAPVSLLLFSQAAQSNWLLQVVSCARASIVTKSKGAIVAAHSTNCFFIAFSHCAIFTAHSDQSALIYLTTLSLN